MKYIDDKQTNNSERPVDALAEKHPWLTDNLKSRDASASKNFNIGKEGHP